jgi:ABC-2 type transport system permease protein
VSTLIIAVLLGVFQILLIAVSRGIFLSDEFDRIAALLPPYLREMIGSSLSAFLSFRGVVCIGYIHLVPLAALIGLTISLGSMVAGDIESGLMELLLARAVARHWIVSRSLLAMVVGVTGVVGVMLTGTWVGLEGLAPASAEWPSRTLLFSLASNLAALAVAWGGVALAISAAARRRSTAVAATALLALFMFLVDYIARIWQPARLAGWISPFHYYDSTDLILGKPLIWRNIYVLCGVLVCSVTVAYIAFSRRDVSA